MSLKTRKQLPKKNTTSTEGLSSPAAGWGWIQELLQELSEHVSLEERGVLEETLGVKQSPLWVALMLGGVVWPSGNNKRGTHGFSFGSSAMWQNFRKIISELELWLLKASSKLSINSWVSLSSLAALFDVRVFKMAALTYFYGCCYPCLISSTPKSSLSPIKSLKLCGTQQRPLTRSGMVSEWAECVWDCHTRRREEVWYASPSSTNQGKSFGIPRLLFFFTHLQFLSARCHHFTERRFGDSSNLVHCQTVNVLRGLGLIFFR